MVCLSPRDHVEVIEDVHDVTWVRYTRSRDLEAVVYFCRVTWSEYSGLLYLVLNLKLRPCMGIERSINEIREWSDRCIRGQWSRVI